MENKTQTKTKTQQGKSFLIITKPFLLKTRLKVPRIRVTRIFLIVIIKKTPLYNENRPITNPITKMEVAHTFVLLFLILQLGFLAMP